MDIQDWVALCRNTKEKVLNYRDGLIDWYEEIRGKGDYPSQSKPKRSLTIFDKLPTKPKDRKKKNDHEEPHE